MPTPPAGSAGSKAQGVPKTPTKSTPAKIGKKPGGTSQQKPSPALKGATPTPKVANADKPATDSLSVLAKPNTGNNSQQSTKDVSKQAKSSLQQADSKAKMEDDDDEGPMSKVETAGEPAKEGLEEVAPEPIEDDDDTVSGAHDSAGATAENTPDEAEDVADNATKEAGELEDSAGDPTDGHEKPLQQESGGLLKGAQGLAEKASGLASKGSKDPTGTVKEATGNAEKVAEDTAMDGQGTPEQNANVVKSVPGEPIDETRDATEGAREGVEKGAEAVAEYTQQGAEDGAEGAEKDVQDGAESAHEGVEDVKDVAENALPEGGAEGMTHGVHAPEGLPLDLSILKGLEVQDDGNVSDGDGKVVGRLAEGDAEDLAGYPIGDDGEILDDDGDLVGRVELHPDEIKKQLTKAKEDGVDLPDSADEYLEQLKDGEEDAADEAEEEAGPALPGLQILSDLTCQLDGLVYDKDGNTVGRVVDGDAEKLQNVTLNESGEFVDEKGNVVGHAEIHNDAAHLVGKGVYEAAEPTAEDADEEAGDEVDNATGDAKSAEHLAEGVQAENPGIEDQLPGIEALKGLELNESGEVHDADGNLLANVNDDELKGKIAKGEINPEDLKIDDEGQVVNDQGNVLGQTELVEGAAEKLAHGGTLLDLRIVEGKKVNKKGKIFDGDGEEIGELHDGELQACVGKKVNARGEVLDRQGKIVGHVKVVPGEAAENATRELLEELQESSGEAEEVVPDSPGLEVLDGLKVNKKGQILNEDGEPIGELTDGDLSDCVGKKVNDQGEVLSKDGTVIGHVKTIAQGAVEEAGEAEEEDAWKEEDVQNEEKVKEEEDAGGKTDEERESDSALPPLSVLEGLAVNKAGKLIDAKGTVVGELVEGDAKKLSRSGNTADAEGQFWDNKGHVIGRAQTVPTEDPDEEATFAGLEGLHVVEDGYVQDSNGHKVGRVTEGDAKKLIGREVDEDGDILDKKGSVVGHAERYEEPETPAEEAPTAADLSFLRGETVNKAGLVIGDEGTPVARLIEGKAKDLAGKQLDDQGQIWNDQGSVIGRVELVPDDEREAKPEGPFAGLEGLRVIKGGKVADEDDNVVGEITEGNARRLVGLAVDEDGDILDRYGNVKGHAEPLPEEEDDVPVDNSILNGKILNKQGYVVNEEGMPFGRLVEGDAAELAGRRCGESGFIYNDTGKVAGKCEVIPEGERKSRAEGPFAGLEGLRVVKAGKVEDEDGNVVGEIVEGNAKRLVGMAVDEDGDILDRTGNVKGKAVRWEEEEQPEEDLTALAGTKINKSGNAVDGNGRIVGRVVEGDPKTMIGKKVNGQGQIWDNAGNVVGRCVPVFGEDTSAEGPFAGFEHLQIQKDRTIATQAGDIVGVVTEGDIKKLMGHTVDEDGDINDKNGNTIGKAERWEPDEKERRANPMSGLRVNKEGEIRDENGELVGKLTEGDLGHCVGQEIDDAGNVVDIDGNKIGEATLLENIAEEEFEGRTEEELAEAAKREEEREVAAKMGSICTQTLERMQPICKQITDHMDKADRTPKEELDEEELVNQVKPLIEEGGRILQECNGSLRGLDPDGKIAAQAKGRAGTGEATPEEHRLAETLKEITTTVVTTIENAKKKLNDMPHAKRKLNPLWALMTQPLFQILAAVGLLLAGVLGLVGQLLNTLGLGGLVNGLLGGLGIDKLLGSFGLGGDKKGGQKGGKKGGGLSSLPVVGGLLGGK